ncbi:DoxX family membrane protein [Xylophilus rhododendri]|uniref:DoxX family membrane protein n=1 Tax=Xylophilus rhododendri TaxID=2697032 RepID=A0A857J0Z3_9BURK|nr:DoxX family protein [Xylophilus rhododendri]QHI96933.1 DoxX family membrane protein [Xylophilus rhododendri]
MSTTNVVALPQQSREDAAKLVLRLLLGSLTLLHGIAKLQSGPGFVLGLVQQAGLPSFVAYGVYIGEVVAPVLLIIGLFTRPAALIVVVNMLVAFSLVHMSQIFTLGKQGGWALELQGFFLFTAVAIALLGAGRYSVGGVNGRFN